MYSAPSRITSAGVVFQSFVFLPDFFFLYSFVLFVFFPSIFLVSILFFISVHSSRSMLFLLFAMHKNFWVTAKRCEYLDFCKSNEILVEEEKKKAKRNEYNRIFARRSKKIIYFLLATLCARNTRQQQNKSTHTYTQIANGSRARSIYMFLREKKKVFAFNGSCSLQKFTCKNEANKKHF